MSLIQGLALTLALLPLVNSAFLFASFRTYWEGDRHQILFGLLVINLVIWAVGGFVGIIAARVAVGLPGLPANGMVLGLVFLAVSLLPAYIWAVMRRFRS